MKKSWNLTQKILTGQKTVESRWYKAKVAPWNRVYPGDTIYFKDSGDPVTIKAEVSKVEQIENLDDQKAFEIMKKYSLADLGEGKISTDVKEYIQGKKYCILVHLKNPEKVEPFEINKKGFGLMSAWICVDNLDKVKK